MTKKLPVDLDAAYPNLAGLVATVLGLSLEELATRAPADGYKYYDLERLLADVKTTVPLADNRIFGYFIRQSRGYLSVIDAYIAAGIPRSPQRFIEQKLLAPRSKRSQPLNQSEFLDTMAECQWAMKFLDEGYVVEEEVALPNGGDADFRLTRGSEILWVDCYSPAPRTRPKTSLAVWLAEHAASKWQNKFSVSRGAHTLPAGIAINLMKADEVMPAVVFAHSTDGICEPPAHLWTQCPALQRVWISYVPFEEVAPRPAMLWDWCRP